MFFVLLDLAQDLVLGDWLPDPNSDIEILCTVSTAIFSAKSTSRDGGRAILKGKTRSRASGFLRGKVLVPCILSAPLMVPISLRTASMAASMTANMPLAS